ncbi:hypothetical protein SAMN05661091_3996 [Paenibacillus uliginis N3/975]|uniref:Uncharacterized protein n=1 Tax=Paenibacillus uliginis N3/975 TaxID=1313296 RepID=A0A1X7HJV9_9BACL|nr:hypothetical protein SAMN05661091_3996 [Paenibacillus uliginis N3/975]
MIRKYTSWLFTLYFIFKFMVVLMTDGKRVPLYDLVFYDKIQIYIKRHNLIAIPQKLFISNHIVQCFAIICFETERILARFQTFKEPDPFCLTN